jgi:hypothetical protein
MSTTAEAIYAAILKPITPLHKVPEIGHPKVCFMVKALPVTAPHENVSDV